MVRSQLDYASTVWSPWLNKDKMELEKVQQRAARFVCNNFNPMDRVSIMIEQLGWQKLEHCRDNSRYASSLRLCNIKYMSLSMISCHRHQSLQRDHFMNEIY